MRNGVNSAAGPLALRDLLVSQLRAVGSSFEEDELAYLALTQKVELHFRDRLAWGLHKALEPDQLVVAREWRRADLAIVQGEIPIALVEAKALYSFDIHLNLNRSAYLARIRADFAKAAALAPSAERYALVIVTNVDDDIPPHLRKHVVKYAPGILKAIAQFGSGTAVGIAATTVWDAEIAALGLPVEQVAIPAGAAWGIDVTINAWLVGPQR